MNLFPEINNKQAFLVKEHPTFYPGTNDYISYWKEQKKRSIEGLWAEDSSKEEKEAGEKSYRFMPGALYFYGNLATIKIVDAKQKITKFERPSIDDVEWIIFTVLLVCRGFSGFELDKEFTCNYDVLEEDYKGKKRTFISPWEYLKQRHKKPLGKALYENPAQNLLLLSSRGIGKTYSISSVIASEILLDGAKEYTQETINNPANITVFVGAYKGDKSTNLLNAVDDIISELPGAYGKGDNRVLSPFHKELTGVNKPGSIREHSYKVKEGGSWEYKGSGSKIVHEVITVSNPQAAAAYRATLAIVEEIGLLEADIEEVLGAVGPVLQVGAQKFGSFIGIGTGGNIDKVSQLETVFRNPKDYKFFSMHDVFENMGDIGLFIPTQYMYREYKDINGNTNWDLANAAVEKSRKGLKYQALEQQKMNYPIIPSEIFMSNRGSVFPQDEINKQLKWVIANELKIDKFANYGFLTYEEKGVKFNHGIEGTWSPIRKFPLEKGANIKGAVVIYEFPPDYIPEGLYKIVYDPVRDDNIDKMDRGISLAAIYVYKSYQVFDGARDQIVAHYVGRLPNTDDIHEIAIKLAIFFNAKIMVEMDLPGFYKYCMSTKKLSFLAGSPWITIGKFNPNAKRRYSVGIMMKGNRLLQLQAEQYISRWLLQERDVEYDEQGNVSRVRRNIDFIYDKPLLEELKNYNRLGNFDRISALSLLVIWLEETKEQIIHETEEGNVDRFDEFLLKHFK